MMFVAVFLFFQFARTRVLALDSRLADSKGVPGNAASRKLFTPAAIPVPTIRRTVILVNNPNKFYYILCIILLVGLSLQLLWFIARCFLNCWERRRYGRVDEEGQTEDKGDSSNGVGEGVQNEGMRSDGNESDVEHDDDRHSESGKERE